MKNTFFRLFKSTLVLTLPLAAATNDVNRVDAYLYSAFSIIWPAYGNILLNGGFSTPNVIITSAAQTWTGNWWCSNPTTRGDINTKHNQCGARTGVLVNPRNGLSTDSNVIRYDYRTRVGSPGFETLKKYFN
jgi:hypothetical protein